MLRTLIVGAIAAFAGSRLIKANEEGKLDGLKERARDGYDRLRDRLSRGEDALVPATAPVRNLPPPPKASRKARPSPTDEVSKPARAHPWPVDLQAMPEKS
ncbi:hypothetical protein [Sphingobium nicotianae]|uniref:Uncharacterized protein n=1 Tax=Sphingobium nicotianae TaxID=2782607 RepID=A0A9X1D9P4_9SPHN|nr:hypothetical protein [Sphingobium nicotianae]MBT2185945.1 hypothetical protein [Sphingobium nicotianae]